MGSSVFSLVQKVQKVRFLVYFLAHFAMAVETKIFLSKKKKTIMSEYRSPLVEPEPVPEPVKVKEPPVPEKIDEINPEISKSAHSVESVKESDLSESDEEFSDCESEDEIQTDSSNGKLRNVQKSRTQHITRQFKSLRRPKA